MFNPIPHIINGNTFWISPERCIYWEEQNALILADIHLGKAGHFRNAGVAVPQRSGVADLQRLIAQLFLFKANRVIIVGDFTHSVYNKELSLFRKWRSDFPLFQFDLVKGNHDILKDIWYRETQITVHNKELRIENFCFRHEYAADVPLQDIAADVFVFSGHVHPAVRISGRGKQALHLPCFYFSGQHCILPAFSKFTGSYIVVTKKGDIVYAMTGTEIIKKP